jgi:hypothetical protein
MFTLCGIDYQHARMLRRPLDGAPAMRNASGFDTHNRYTFFVDVAHRVLPNPRPGHALRMAA